MVNTIFKIIVFSFVFWSVYILGCILMDKIIRDFKKRKEIKEEKYETNIRFSATTERKNGEGEGDDNLPS